MPNSPFRIHGLPVLLLMKHFMGLSGIEMSQAVSETISAIITLPFLISFFRNLPEDSPSEDQLQQQTGDK